jgi:hypothetical protein
MDMLMIICQAVLLAVSMNNFNSRELRRVTFWHNSYRRLVQGRLHRFCGEKDKVHHSGCIAPRATVEYDTDVKLVVMFKAVKQSKKFKNIFTWNCHCVHHFSRCCL